MYQKSSNQLDNPKTVQYDLGQGLYARVVTEVQLRKTDRIEVEIQAFQIDASGSFVSTSSGAPGRTPGTPHVIALSGVAAGTHTLKPGWVRVVGNFNSESLPEGCSISQTKPSEPGSFGDTVYDEVAGILYRFDMGELERLRQGKCEELQSIIDQHSAMADLDM